MKRHASHLSAEEMAYESLKVAADICVFTNDDVCYEKHYNNQSTINNYEQLILVKRRRNEINGYSWNQVTPKEIVSKLNEYIVGQNDAKRKVAIALRNRYRRSLLDEESKQEISPKNILMIGPTGVGKTEIARNDQVLAHHL